MRSEQSRRTFRIFSTGIFIISIFTVLFILKSDASAQKRTLKRPPERKIDMRPDLIVYQFRLVLNDPETGKFYTYTKLKNIGKSILFISRGWPIVQFNHSGWEPDHWREHNLGKNVRIPPGGKYLCRTMHYRSPGQHDPGSHTITVKADPKNKINESNENNNLKSATIVLTHIPLLSAPAGHPDLVIDRVYTDPPIVTLENDFKVLIGIKNIGSNSARFRKGMTLVHSINLSYSPLDEDWVIAPGGYKVIRQTPRNYERGTFTWEVKVNRNKRVTESNYDNNNFSFSITIN